MVNFYDVIPEQYLDKEIWYPNIDKLKCKLPSIWNFSGPTGTGKSNAVMNVIKAYNCFQKIHFFAKSFDEPLYRWIIAQIREVERLHDVDILVTSNDLMDLPPLEEVDNTKNNLFIFDDMIGEKDKLLEKMSQYAIRGRKRNASFWFLSQSYFDIPGLFRKQQNYVVLTGINTWEDLKRIMREMAISIPTDVLIEMFKQVQNIDSYEPKPLDDFFLIDNVLNNPLQKCRLRFEPIDPRPFFEKLGLPAPIVKDGKLVEVKKRKRPEDDDEANNKERRPKRKTMDDHWKEEQKEVAKHQKLNEEADDKNKIVSRITKKRMMVHTHEPVDLGGSTPEQPPKKRKRKEK